MSPQEPSAVPTYDVPATIKGKTDIDLDTYKKMYQSSVEDPEAFWAEQAEKFVTWYDKWDTVLDWDFNEGNIEWFRGGKLNVSYNCLDRHVEAGHGSQTALIWEGNNPDEDSKVTYKQLLDQVCQFASHASTPHNRQGAGRLEQLEPDHLNADQANRLVHHVGVIEFRLVCQGPGAIRVILPTARPVTAVNVVPVVRIE